MLEEKTRQFVVTKTTALLVTQSLWQRGHVSSSWVPWFGTVCLLYRIIKRRGRFWSWVKGAEATMAGDVHDWWYVGPLANVSRLCNWKSETVSLTVAAIPGVLQMAKRKAIVKKLHSVGPRSSGIRLGHLLWQNRNFDKERPNSYRSIHSRWNYFPWPNVHYQIGFSRDQEGIGYRCSV